MKEAHWSDMDERLWEFLKRTQDHDPVPDALRLRCPNTRPDRRLTCVTHP